jgi:hypothetical protein
MNFNGPSFGYPGWDYEILDVIVVHGGEPAFGVNWDWFSSDVEFTIPSWFLAAMFAALGIAPWVRYRFSLRTLLIAITVIGLLLGTIIVTTR